MNHVTMAAQRWEIVYKDLLKSLSTDGQKISPRKGAAREIIGGTFKLENPRDRCLLSPARGFNVFQAVGHWLWIMAGRMDLPSINYYNPRAPTFSADLRKLDGAYGPRLFGLGVLNQIPHIIDLVTKNPDTRRAVASVYIPEFDSSRTTVQGREDEVPCTIAMQFLPRGGSLNMIVFMRSQDAFGVLPYDLFIFTLIQEFIAKSTKSEMGNYNLHAGSMHYYLRDEARVQEVLTEPPVAAPIMPAMPDGSQDEFLKKVLELEEAIRVECSAHIRLPFGRSLVPATTCSRRTNSTTSGRRLSTASSRRRRSNSTTRRPFDVSMTRLRSLSISTPNERSRCWPSKRRPRWTSFSSPRRPIAEVRSQLLEPLELRAIGRVGETPTAR